MGSGATLSDAKDPDLPFFQIQVASLAVSAVTPAVWLDGIEAEERDVVPDLCMPTGPHPGTELKVISAFICSFCTR